MRWKKDHKPKPLIEGADLDFPLARYSIEGGSATTGKVFRPELDIQPDSGVEVEELPKEETSVGSS